MTALQWPLGLSNLSGPVEKPEETAPNNTIDCPNCKKEINSVVFKYRSSERFEILEADDRTYQLKLKHRETMNEQTIGSHCPNCNLPVELADYNIKFE